MTGTAVEVATIEQLPDRTPVTVRVDGRDLLLIRWANEVYAVRSVCPHMAAPLGLGKVIPHYRGTAGQVEIDEEDAILACPWHKYEFLLRDGRCLTSPTLRIRSYPTIVENGKVYVNLSGHRGRAEGSPKTVRSAG